MLRIVLQIFLGLLMCSSLGVASVEAAKTGSETYTFPAESLDLDAVILEVYMRDGELQNRNYSVKIFLKKPENAITSVVLSFPTLVEAKAFLDLLKSPNFLGVTTKARQCQTCPIIKIGLSFNPYLTP